MIERYKVLGAMLALGDFTVPELAQYSGVRPQTVRTVVTRERRNLKPLGKEARAGRGGRFKRFQVQLAQVEDIRQELNELYRALPRERPVAVPQQSLESEPVPLAILAAEDMLIRRFPEAGEREERKRLLNLAGSVWVRYGSGLPEEELPGTTRLHLESLDGLRKLCSAELATTYEPFFARVAFDRAIKLSETCEHSAGRHVERWKIMRQRIHREVCEKGYNPTKKAFTQFYGSDALDASLLMMPRVGFLPSSDERVRGTIEAIQRELVQDGLVLRYRPDQGVDGLPGREGTFLPCSFWLANGLHSIGRTEEAKELFERLLTLRNDVGLISEEYDPIAKRQLGNFPQAFTHLALVNCARILSGDEKFPTPET